MNSSNDRHGGQDRLNIGGEVQTSAPADRCRLVRIRPKRLLAISLGLAFWTTTGLIVARLFWHGERVFDIILWDETSYLYQGLKLRPGSFGSFETSPGYSLFYFLLSKVIADPVDLYLCGGIVITCLALIAVMVGTLAASRSRALALAVGAFLILTGYVFVWPRVTLAAIALIGAIVAVSANLRGAYTKLSFVTTGTYLLTFVRPEFALSFFILLASTILAGIRTFLRGEASPRERLLARANLFGNGMLVPLVVLVVIFGFPPLSGQGRAYVAFAQHFVLRHLAEAGSNLDPWTNWERVIAEVFPNASSIGEAFVSSPRAFLGHLRSNCADLVSGVSNAILSGPANRLELHGSWASLAWLMIVASVFGAVLARVLRKRDQPRRAERLALALDLFVIAALMIPVVFSVIVIYPRPHYILMLLVLLLVAMARVARSDNVQGANVDRVGAVLAACALAWLIRPLPAVATPTKDLILQLRSFEVRGLFELEGNICAYMIPPCRSVYPWSWAYNPAEPITSYLDRHGVDAILVSPALRGFAPLAADRQWNELLHDPARFGFSTARLTPAVSLLLRAKP